MVGVSVQVPPAVTPKLALAPTVPGAGATRPPGATSALNSRSYVVTTELKSKNKIESW